uniref:Secreted protein n=1 Tax=Steinernema glaseri TaxID=37863 RepID=A0A1I7XWW9_9BILA
MGSCRNGSITLIFIQLLALVCGIPDLLQPQRTQRAAKLFIKKVSEPALDSKDINSFDTLAGIGLGKRDASASSPSFYHYVPPMMSSDYAANMNLFRTSQLLARLRL